MKKFISAFIRIAKEGLTIDGREITAEQIAQMAASYAPAKYGARIWIEHFRSLLPDGAFPALGDVIALKTDKDTDGKLLLLAQLRPNDKLMSLNKENQKVFTSIEMDPNFAGSGQAYLVGLAVTDSPASLGTEMLTFSQKHRAEFSDADKVPTNHFSPAIEAGALDFTEENTPDPAPSLLSKVKSILEGKDGKADARFTDMQSSIVAIAEGLDTLGERIEAMSTAQPTPPSTDPVAALAVKVEALTKQLTTEPDPTIPTRPEAVGLNGVELTDC